MEGLVMGMIAKRGAQINLRAPWPDMVNAYSNRVG